MSVIDYCLLLTGFLLQYLAIDQVLYFLNWVLGLSIKQYSIKSSKEKFLGSECLLGLDTPSNIQNTP